MTLVLIGVGATSSQQTKADAVQSDRFAWVQYAPEGYQVRAITTEDECPTATVTAGRTTSAREVPLEPRALPDGRDYPELVCELDLPPSTSSVRIAEYALDVNLTYADIDRILVFGDSGCRIKVNDGEVQACNDPDEFPLATIAASAAVKDFDVIVHTGDIYYREDPCPEDYAGCAGSPYGAKYATLKADFFEPVRELLAAGPWVFVRGNHEMCGRNGTGWTRYFSPDPYGDGECWDYEQPYTLDFGTVQLLMMDTSASLDSPPLDREQIALYRDQFRELAETPNLDRSWLLTHHPIWGMSTRPRKVLPDGSPGLMSHTLMRAIVDEDGNRILNAHVALAGHVHNFTFFDYGDPMPQFMIANGGVMLDDAVGQDQVGRRVGGRTIERLTSFSEFGFSLAELQSGGDWVFTQYDKDGMELGVRCSIDRRTCTR